AVTAGPPAKPARRPRDEDEKDDRPQRKRRRDDDDDDDEDRPRSRRRDEDEDEEEDEDEDRPRKKKKKKRRGGGIPMWVWFAGGGGILAVGLVVLLIFVLGGSGNKFGKVKEGMTVQEVKDLLGTPTIDGISNGNGAAVWYDPPVKPEELRSFDIN